MLRGRLALREHLPRSWLERKAEAMLAKTPAVSADRLPRNNRLLFRESHSQTRFWPLQSLKPKFDYSHSNDLVIITIVAHWEFFVIALRLLQVRSAEL